MYLSTLPCPRYGYNRSNDRTRLDFGQHLCRQSLIRQRRAVCERAIRPYGIVAIASKVIVRLCQHPALHLEESVELTPTIITQSTSWEADAQWQSTLVEDEVDVGCLRACLVRGSVLARTTERRWSLDDFHIQTSAKWLHMGNDQAAVGDDVRGGQERRELREAEGGQDAHDVRVVGEVEVEGLVYWERRGVVIERDVDLRNRLSEDVVLEASNNLLYVADTDSAASGRLEGVVTSEADVDAVLVTLPLLVREEIAEGGVAKSDSFVSTHGLSVVGVGDSPVEAGCFSMKALGGVR